MTIKEFTGPDEEAVELCSFEIVRSASLLTRYMSSDVLDQLDIVDTRLFSVVLLKKTNGKGSAELLGVLVNVLGPLGVILFVGFSLGHLKSGPNDVLKMEKFLSFGWKFELQLYVLWNICVIGYEDVAKDLFWQEVLRRDVCCNAAEQVLYVIAENEVDLSGMSIFPSLIHRIKCNWGGLFH